MGFFDNAQEVFDKGVSVAKGAVSGVAVEQQSFARAFARLCAEGWDRGWHEANGGNLTYCLAEGDVTAARPFFYDNPSSWVPTGLEAARSLAGEYFLVTAAGSVLRNVALDLDANAGIVEVNTNGDAWRIVWGFKNGGLPTSEFASHLAVYARRRAAGKTDRVLYHAHPTNLVALTHVLPLDSRTFTRALWKSLMECMVVLPQGIGVVGWTLPGGSDLAEATADILVDHNACVWAHHGLMTCGDDFDEAFGRALSAEKAALIYATARALNGGSDAFASAIPDEGLRGIAEVYELAVNEAYLA